MLHPLERPLVLALLAGGAVLGAQDARAQTSEEDYLRAYYLETAEGEPARALELYQAVARSEATDAELRRAAQLRAAGLAEDLMCADFARLMPPETALYAELNRPGEQLASLAAGLGLLRAAGSSLHEPGLSPLLFSGLMGVRGAAVAVTSFHPRSGPRSGVIVLHTGDSEVLRGLLETLMPGAAEPSGTLSGFPLWKLEGEAFVALTHRLCVVGKTRADVEGVLERLAGTREASLATHAPAREALALRGDDLLYFCVNAEPVKPLLVAALDAAAAHYPGAAMTQAFLDVENLRSLSGRLSCTRDGLALDVALDLEEGHRNLAFNLLRMPSVKQRTLELVPEGAAFFFVTALNDRLPLAPQQARSDSGQPIVTMMDFGREVFANVVDVAVYGLPAEGAASGAWQLPDVAASITVNDAQRSHALWAFLLGSASGSTAGGSMEPTEVRIAGRAAERYSIEGIPVFLLTDEHRVLVSPSKRAIERSLAAGAGGRSVLDDAAYAPVIAGLGRPQTWALLASPSRCLHLTLPFAPQQRAQELASMADVLEGSVFALGVEHSDTRLRLTARVTGLPDLGPIAQTAMRNLRRASLSPLVSRAAPEPALVGAFEALVGDETHHAAALEVGEKLLEAHHGDPQALNNFAWALLTESRYGNRFDGLALRAAEQSNRATRYENWAYLDTLALACFQMKHYERAVQLEAKAVERAPEDQKAGLRAIQAAFEDAGPHEW